MRVTPAYRPVIGVILAAVVLLGSVLAVGWSAAGAADEPRVPTIEPRVSGSDGDNGWSTGDVTVSWRIRDPDRQIASTAGCDEVKLTADMGPTTYTCSAALITGGTPVTASTVVKIDRTDPVITCPPPPMFGIGAAGEFTASAADATSGAPASVGVPIDTSAAGNFSAVLKVSDAAGNDTTQTCAYSVVADTTPPTVTVAVAGPTGEDGWYIGDVTIAFTVTEDTTNVSTDGCYPPTLTTDTTGTVFTCTAVSGGGSAVATTTVKRDATPPVITCPAPPEVIQGNSTTVVATIADATSGATASSGSAVGAATALGEHTVTIGAGDLAGNTAEAQCAYTVVPDPNAPIVTPVVVGPTAEQPDPANSQLRSFAASSDVAEWYTGDVTVRFAIDANSPLLGSAGCDPVTISEDTPGVTVTCTATSFGGTTTNSVTIARDATPPTVTCPAQLPMFVNGVQGAAAQFTAAFADATSGVSADSAALSADTSQVGVHSLAVSTQDAAGNVTAGQCEYQVVRDYTPPVIRVSVAGTSGDNGWYVGAVTVTFSVDDDDSPLISSAGCEPRVIDQDTNGTRVECSATSYGGGDNQFVDIKRDTVGPQVTCMLADFVQGTPGRVAATADDPTSGVSATSVFAQANTSSTGERFVSLSTTDEAGNVTSVQCQYGVLAPATVKAARLSRTGQNLMVPLVIAGMLVLFGGAGLALAARRRAFTGRHGTTSGDGGTGS